MTADKPDRFEFRFAGSAEWFASPVREGLGYRDLPRGVAVHALSLHTPGRMYILKRDTIPGRVYFATNLRRGFRRRTAVVFVRRI